MANEQSGIPGCVGAIVVIVLCITFCVWGPRDNDVIHPSGLTFGELTNIYP